MSNQLYQDLSHYYDQFCTHINYEEQQAFAERAFHCFSSSNGRTYLDLACGTGQLLTLMSEKNFDVTGLDNSEEMLKQAAARCPSATLQCNDLAKFENKNEFDLITCFLYSMHYSHPLTAFRESIHRAYTALKPGGVFIFDTVNKDDIANDRGVITHLDTQEASLSFQSRWWYAGEGDVLDLHLTITRQDQQGTTTWHDHHKMTAINIIETKTLMEQAGFEIFILDRDFSRLKEWNGETSNVLFAGIKPQTSNE